MKVKLLRKLRKGLRISKVYHANINKRYYKFEEEDPTLGWVIRSTSSHFFPCVKAYHEILRKRFDHYRKYDNYHIDIVYP